MGETTNARGVKLKKTGEMMIVDAELTLAELDATHTMRAFLLAVGHNEPE
jgi:hypothetical protein